MLHVKSKLLLVPPKLCITNAFSNKIIQASKYLWGGRKGGAIVYEREGGGHERMCNPVHLRKGFRMSPQSRDYS